MTPQLSHDQRREVQAHFLHADTNGDRRINQAEFREVLANLEADMSEEEMQLGFDLIDSDDDGYIDFEEFLTWWQES